MNISRDISEDFSTVEDDVDECAQDPTLCGMEQGCLNTIGSYMCYCPHDLLPVGKNHSCDEDRFSLSTPSSFSDSNKTRDYLPIEGTIGDHPLLNVLKNSRVNPENGTATEKQADNNSQNASSVYSLQVLAGSQGTETLVLACVIAVFLVSAISLTACMWNRRRRRLSWLPFCCQGNRSGIVTAASIGKCLQQYVTNPNYYSNSPDGALMKVLRDMAIPQENIMFLEEIGEGCFGKVHKGLYTTPAGVAVPVAVKVLKEGATTEAHADFEREVEIMSSFHHENILKLLGVVFKDGRSTEWMVFEYMQFGDLAQLLRSNSPWFRRPSNQPTIDLCQHDMIYIATQIACGMVYLSSQHFAHRDLATRNCLVGENLIVKISDFGMSRDIYTSDYYKIGGSRMLPVRWMAPESITYGEFSLESDVWAYGVVLWEIFTFGKQPYYGHSNDEVVKLILQGILLSPPENCPPFIYSIMAGCWKTNPRHRHTFPEIHEMLVANCVSRNEQSQSTTLSSDDGEIVDNDNYLRSTAVTAL